ncbi:MAG: hypothetical protein ABWU13_25340, partial [Limnospira maxima]
HVQTITIEPAPQASWIDAPADITITCEEALDFAVADLAYSNNENGSCEISGSVLGTLSGSFNECGGTQTISWTFTDNCGRTIDHVQTIAIEPAPQASWIDAPADITITCEEALDFEVADLAYSNNENGSCEISGSVSGTLSGSFDECGGTQTISWTFTDNCGRTIDHVQTITIEPAPQASWIEAPADITITCEEALDFEVADLAYSNDESGSCEISGSVPGTLAGSFDEC